MIRFIFILFIIVSVVYFIFKILGSIFSFFRIDSSVKNNVSKNEKRQKVKIEDIVEADFTEIKDDKQKEV